MTTEAKERAKAVRQSFRLLMNGEAADSMRRKGLGYRVVWGAALTDLKRMAAEIGKDAALAAELWKDDVRESKITATLTMPPGEMSAELAEEWARQLGTTEMAELAAFNLFQYVEGIADCAFRWIAAEDELLQICGYGTISGLLKHGGTLAVEDSNEIADQAAAALSGGSTALKRAAANCMALLEG